MKLFWLSFAGEEGFRGVVLVDADDFLTAHLQTVFAGINPGGEVIGHELPPDVDTDQARLTYALPRLTLLSRADLEKHGIELENP